MSGPSDPVAPSTGFSHAEILSIVSGLMLAMMLAALDQTIVATALPTIGADLNDFVNLSWVVTAYLLASTTVTPLYGKLSDIHGRGPVLLVAIALFSIGSLACALAENMLVLVIARGLQGLGGGGLISLAQTVVADVVSPRERGRYQGYFASVFAVASIAGPVIGGVVAQHLHWSLIFWINLPLGLAAFLVIRPKLARLPRHGRPHKLDYPGCGLMVVSSTCLLLAVTWGGVQFPWTSLEILALLTVAAVAGVLFVVRMRTAPEPFLPLAILADPVVGSAIGAACFIYGTMIALTIVSPLYFETARGFSSSVAGMALIPQMGATVAGAVLGGRAMARMTHYKRPAVVLMFLSTFCLLALALIPVDWPVWVWIALLSVASLGMGTVFPISTVCIQNAVPIHLLGTATGAANFFRALGGALMVAMLGAVFIGALGASKPGDLAQLAQSSDTMNVAFAFKIVFGCSAVALLIGTGFLIAMKQLPLRATVREAAEIVAVE
ncbi:MDR family MFS transporter [Aquabacter spiritensis]|uniref:EmrB/QacA subfamily drug resistance transporter n=1 Tax=Aquabacter spiritensis TaxID=933073 RepID=A0A4V2UXC0_9HYPH|nr:MDR family MFS transporter [Aquabacter spiritensis]TCT02868.1 EmrB/QacA subfamily drug resistance transporter [Aquabacter spiritensis]